MNINSIKHKAKIVSLIVTPLCDLLKCFGEITDKGGIEK